MNQVSEEVAELSRPDGHRVAYRRIGGRSPTLMFIGGFRSDMTGMKAKSVAALAARLGHACLRFDPLGHGASTGRFEDGTIGRWRDDTLAALDALTEGPVVLIGSSMGVWLALHAAIARPDRVIALLGIAGAPDFTEDLLLPALPEAMRAALREHGRVEIPSEYGAPFTLTETLITEARDHLLLRAPIDLTIPVRLMHGMQDPDVPWQTSLRLSEVITGNDVRLTLIKDGDHRLSRPEDIALLERLLIEVLDESLSL